MKIKIINPNTSQVMTDRMRMSALAVAAAGTTIEAVSPSGGPAAIEGFYDETYAALGLLEEVRKGERDGFDAYVVACFSDAGISAARELAAGPVVGIAPAAMQLASTIGLGFSIVSMLDRAKPMLGELVRRAGMSERCRSIRMTNIPLLAVEAGPVDVESAIIQECRAAVEVDGADCVILGSGGLGYLAAPASQAIGAPVIDAVAAAVKWAEGIVALGLQTSKRHAYAYPIEKTYSGELNQFSPSSAQVR